MANKELNFRAAVNRLAKLNGLHTIKELTGSEFMKLVEGPNNQTYRVPTNSELEQQIIQLFVDNSEGTYLMKDLITELQAILSGGQNTNPEELRTLLNKTFQVWYTAEARRNLTNNQSAVGILDVLGYASGQGSSGGNSTIINSSPNSPDKEHPALSVVLSNSHRVGLIQKDTNPAVLFLNSIPQIEMSRATPFVRITFNLGRPPKSGTGRVQTMSLVKFLTGAEESNDGTTLNNMVMANQSPGNRSIEGAGTYAGMELFTAPQTLVNANEVANSNLRSNAVLDHFKPFMTLKSLNLSVAPSTGLMSFKSGKLNLILHDRSRMADIADFIRPELYGTTEIEIEYGWHHPDGEALVMVPRNPYGDLINGLRNKEKYTIINSGFGMQESGEVDITLQIAMRGAEAFQTELISSDADGVGNSVREIQRIMRNVAELRSRVFGDGTGFQTREIRGVQILDAANDALNQNVLTNDLREALVAFEASLRNNPRPEASQLLESIQNLYGTVSARGNRRNRNNVNTQESYTTRLRRSVNDSVQRKMTQLATADDPFFVEQEINDVPITRSSPGREFVEEQPSGARGRAELREFIEANAIDNVSPGSTSLAKILLLFIGEPLANTQKFDDVQMIFYPFNAYAGFASKINIGNFAVDNQHFASTFAQWRMNRVGRSANVNLNDFIRFISSTVIDDPSAKSYGLIAEGKSLFKQVFTNDNGNAALSLEAVDDPADHITKLEQILQGVTPDGTFRMPQLDIYLETVSEKQDTVESQEQNVGGVGVADIDGSSQAGRASEASSKTILKVHIYDKHASTYDTLGALLANQRNTELASLGRIASARPTTTNSDGSGERTVGNAGVIESQRTIHNEFLSAAENSGIIEQNPQTKNPDGTTTPATYRVTGGPKQLKEFLYNITPYVIYGIQGTNIESAQLTSMQVPELSTIHLQRNYTRSELEPNGENPGGLPMRIIPTELSVVSQGCPLLNFAQQFFFDFNTGTTADNFYAIVGIEHDFPDQGEFRTTLKLTPIDAYGRYESFLSQLQNAATELENIENESDDNDVTT